MPLPLTVSCFSKIQIGFTFLVPAHPGSPGKRAVKWLCGVCVFLCLCLRLTGSLDFHQETVEFGPTHIFTQIYAPVTVHMISNGSVYSARNLLLTAV